MRINTNGSRNISLDFAVPESFRLSDENGYDVPYLRTGNKTLRLSGKIPQYVDLIQTQQTKRIVKPMQLKAQSVAIVNADDVLALNRTAQILESNQNLLDQTQKQIQDEQEYLASQQQAVSEKITQAEFLVNSNAQKLSVIEKSQQLIINEALALSGALDAHTKTNNPHNITKDVLGLSKVDNTSDADKPLSNAVKQALEQKADKTDLRAVEKQIAAAAEKSEKLNNALSRYSYAGGIGGNELPSGGKTGQILAKKTDKTGEVEWVDNISSTAHNDLTGRDANDAHPIAAISGLKNTLNDLAKGANKGLTAIQPNDNISKLTNDLGYISGIDSDDVAEALGFVPVNSANLGDATLSIQKNGQTIGAFSANATVDKVVNIIVPTTAGDLNALPDTVRYGASIGLSLSETDYKLTMSLVDQTGAILNAQTVDFPIESVVVGGQYDAVNQQIVLTLQNGNTVDVPVGALVDGLQSEITNTNKLASDLVDDNNNIHKFVTNEQISLWNAKQDTLVSGVSIKTINGNSLLGSGDIEIQSSGDTSADGRTITRNDADELQAIGVINQNNTTKAIKSWSGTKDQYAALLTKDADTLYNITDDSDAQTYEAYTKSETDALVNAKQDKITGVSGVGDYVVEWKAPTSADPSWYRKYKSGWVEQGGKFQAATTNVEYTVTLSKPYDGTEYYVSVNQVTKGSGTNTVYDSQYVVNKATGSFGVVQGQSERPYYNWKTEGMGA